MPFLGVKNPPYPRRMILTTVKLYVGLPQGHRISRWSTQRTTNIYHILSKDMRRQARLIILLTNNNKHQARRTKKSNLINKKQDLRLAAGALRLGGIERVRKIYVFNLKRMVIGSHNFPIQYCYIGYRGLNQKQFCNFWSWTSLAASKMHGDGYAIKTAPSTKILNNYVINF